MKHTATIEQKLAFDKVIKAMKAAKKKGLVFYAKSNNLVAYTKQADNYIENEIGFEKSLRSSYGQLPCLHSSILTDSGADDYGSYVSAEDKEKYT